jgi:hypothetical protein
MSRLRKHRVLWHSLQTVFASTALFFLVRAIVTRWSQIAAFPWQFRVVPLVGSITLYTAAGLFWATVWRHMVVRSGCPIKWADGVRVYMVSNLAKYVPGSIWGYVSRAYLGRDEGLTVMGVGISAVWEVGITVMASLLLTVATIPAYPSRIPAAFLRLVLAVTLLCFVGLLPPVFNRWVRLLRRGQSANPPSFRWHDFWLYLVSAFGTHILVGTAFFLFTRSFVDIDLRSWWSLVGLWSFSATAGLVIVLVPYGLGVKEGLLTLFLQPFLPIELATLISLASRLWTVACEVLAALLAVLLLHKFKRHQAE